MLTILVLAAVALAACAAEGGTAPTSTGPASAPDGDWLLVDGVTAVDGYPITLSIDGTTVGGTAACNGYGGTADLSDGGFEFGEFFITEMGCEPAVMEAEAAYVAALLAVTSWQLESGTLLLSGGSDLTFERRPPVPTEALVGTDWLLETLIRGDVASTPLGDPATLRLFPDGTVVGSTGCRALSGTWVVRDGRVFFPEFAADGECPNLLDQDNLIVNVLGDGFDAVVDGDRLTVTSAGSEGLVYRSG